MRYFIFALIIILFNTTAQAKTVTSFCDYFADSKTCLNKLDKGSKIYTDQKNKIIALDTNEKNIRYVRFYKTGAADPDLIKEFSFQLGGYPTIIACNFSKDSPELRKDPFYRFLLEIKDYVNENHYDLSDLIGAIDYELGPGSCQI